jgi:hypothetical protein
MRGGAGGPVGAIMVSPMVLSLLHEGDPAKVGIALARAEGETAPADKLPGQVEFQGHVRRAPDCGPRTAGQ